MDTKILRELIEKNTRVILPEFGAFLVKDDGTGIFKPQNVTFSPFLRFNDGMIEDYLSSHLKVSKDQAKDILTKFISEVKNTLQSEKVFLIGELGSLQIDNRGSIHFTSSTTPPVSPKPSEEKKPENKVVEQDTPLSKPAEEKADEVLEQKEEVLLIEPIINEVSEVEINEEKIKEEAPLEKIEKEGIVQPIATKPVEEITTPPIKKPETPKPTPRAHKITPPQKTITKPVSTNKASTSGTGKAIIYGALIGLGCIILAVSGWYLYTKGYLKFSKESTTQVAEQVVSEDYKKDEPSKFTKEFEEISSKMDKSDTKTEKEVTKEQTTKPSIKAKPKEDDKINVTYPQDNLFHIIAGSFRNKENADKFADEMKRNGFNAKVIVQPSGIYSVALGSFLTRNAAAESMNEWKRQYPNIWILKQ